MAMDHLSWCTCRLKKDYDFLTTDKTFTRLVNEKEVELSYVIVFDWFSLFQAHHCQPITGSSMLSREPL